MLSDDGANFGLEDDLYMLCGAVRIPKYLALSYGEGYLVSHGVELRKPASWKGVEG